MGYPSGRTIGSFFISSSGVELSSETSSETDSEVSTEASAEASTEASTEVSVEASAEISLSASGALEVDCSLEQPTAIAEKGIKIDKNKGNIRFFISFTSVLAFILKQTDLFVNK